MGSEIGLGPWLDCSASPSDQGGLSWWIHRPDEFFTAADALREMLSHDENRDYYGVTYTVELCSIRMLPEDRRDEEHEIEECRYATDEGAMEAWRVNVRE